MSPEPNPPVIAMRGVTVGAFRQADTALVDNVEWTVRPGEFWVVAGRQHAGKSDFLMLTAGLMPPLAGSYQLFGRETRDLGEADLAERLRVGLGVDHGQLFNQMTIAENIALPVRYHRDLDEAEAERETRWLLEWLELTPMADTSPIAVSRDWLKRVALARALVLRPRLLLCDNPLNGLGARHRQWWLSFLDQLVRGDERLGGQPVTVVVTTEDLPPWKNDTRRFALLRDRQFFSLGSWPDMIRAGDPVVQELLLTHEFTT